MVLEKNTEKGGKSLEKNKWGGKDNIKVVPKTILLFFVVFLILAVFIFVILNNSGMTSNVVLNLEGDYNVGENLKGDLKIDLQEGELIPASSKIIFENNGDLYEYTLGELIDAEVIQGDFYIEGSQISGAGEGYGLMGYKEIYPNVYFKFNVYGSSDENSSGGSDEEIVVEDLDNSSVEIIEEILEEVPEPNQEIVLESSVEPVGEIPEEDSSLEVVSITGQISLIFEEEIQGDVSYGNEFKYLLGDGNTAEIVSGSVRTETSELSPEYLNFQINSGELVVTTNYSEKVEGFGEEYLQDGKETFDINISALNLLFEEGNLKVYLVYDSEEIISFETVLKNGTSIFTDDKIQESIIDKNVSQEEIINVSLIQNYFNIENVSLSEEEIFVLLENFPNESISRSAKTYKNWIIVKFKFSNYSAEYNYDSSLNKDVLEKLIEKDRIMWMKDLARKFTREEIFSENLANFSNSYEII